MLLFGDLGEFNKLATGTGMPQEDRFNLLFSGEVTLDEPEALGALCQTFKVSSEQAIQLLRGNNTLTIKRNLTYSQITSLQDKLKKRGIVTRVEKEKKPPLELDLVPIKTDQQPETAAEEDSPCAEDAADLNVSLLLHKSLAIFGIILSAILILAFLPDEQTQFRRGLILGLIILYLSSKRFAALRLQV